ncbi:hypothetical protein [Actinoplanes sp. NPDC049599]|uniref:hypothetical protein n=1 Tax=Actinoplanes sp. NPDC049599 TaxID=3363903 RepID=UPI0037A901AC
MSLQEYIVSGGEIANLLDYVALLPEVSVKRVASRYVVLEASESDAAKLSAELAGRYTITPNKELGLLE